MIQPFRNLPRGTGLEGPIDRRFDDFQGAEDPGLSSTRWILHRERDGAEAWRDAQADEHRRSASGAQLVSGVRGRPKVTRSCRTSAIPVQTGCVPRCK